MEGFVAGISGWMRDFGWLRWIWGIFLAIFLGNSLRNVWYEGISYTCPLSGKGKELSIIFAFEFFPWHFIGCKGERWGVKKVVKGRGGRFLRALDQGCPEMTSKRTDYSESMKNRKMTNLLS